MAELDIMFLNGITIDHFSSLKFLRENENVSKSHFFADAGRHQSFEKYYHSKLSERFFGASSTHEGCGQRSSNRFSRGLIRKLRGQQSQKNSQTFGVLQCRSSKCAVI